MLQILYPLTIEKLLLLLLRRNLAWYFISSILTAAPWIHSVFKIDWKTTKSLTTIFVQMLIVSIAGLWATLFSSSITDSRINLLILRVGFTRWGRHLEQVSINRLNRQDTLAIYILCRKRSVFFRDHGSCRYGGLVWFLFTRGTKVLEVLDQLHHEHLLFGFGLWRVWGCFGNTTD